MSGRSDPDDVSVNEKKAGYSGSSAGPANDTEVHSRETPMPMEWTLSDPMKAQAPAGPEIPDLRKSLRKNDDVDRDRPRDLPSWLPMAAAGVVAFLILAGGAAVMFSQLGPSVGTTAPTKAPVEDLEGVPVRKGLNAE